MKWHARYIIPIVLLVLVGLSVYAIYQNGLYTFWSARGIERLNPKEAAQLLETEQVTILDVRDEREVEVSKMSGAIRYTPEILEKLNTQKPVLLYCTVSVRSNALAKTLKEKGFENVYELRGGLVSWLNAELPVVNAKGTPTDSLHVYNKWFVPFLKNGTAVY